MAEASEVSGLAGSHSSGIAVGRCGRATTTTTTTVASCACGWVRSQRRRRLASRDLESGGQLSETIRRERVRGASRESADKGVEVVKTASADSSDVHQRGSRQHSGAVTGQSESLLTKGSVHGEDVGACTGVESLRVATRLDSDGTSRLEKGNNVDGITQSLVTIRTAQGIGRIAVEAVQVSAVPVDDLILGDVVGNVGVTVLVSSDERLGEIKPAVVRHVIGPPGRIKALANHRLVILGIWKLL